MAGEDRYFEKSHHAMKNHTIKSVKAIKAAEITSKLVWFRHLERYRNQIRDEGLLFFAEEIEAYSYETRER